MLIKKSAFELVFRNRVASKSIGSGERSYAAPIVALNERQRTDETQTVTWRIATI